MKKLIVLNLILSLTLVSYGCLVTGQITLIEPVDIGPTTDTNFNKYDVDLSTNEDWVDNKDKILTVDEVGIVAIIENLAAVAAQAQIYFSNDANLATIAEIQDEATLIFDSPSLPPNSKTTIEWEDGFSYLVNEQVVIDEVLGDGMFTLYGIAKDVPFNLDILGEVSVTVTVEE